VKLKVKVVITCWNIQWCSNFLVDAASSNVDDDDDDDINNISRSYIEDIFSEPFWTSELVKEKVKLKVKVVVNCWNIQWGSNLVVDAASSNVDDDGDDIDNISRSYVEDISSEPFWTSELVKQKVKLKVKVVVNCWNIQWGNNLVVDAASSNVGDDDGDDDDDNISRSYIEDIFSEPFWTGELVKEKVKLKVKVVITRWNIQWGSNLVVVMLMMVSGAVVSAAEEWED